MFAQQTGFEAKQLLVKSQYLKPQRQFGYQYYVIFHRLCWFGLQAHTPEEKLVFSFVDHEFPEL